jgi:hypothetical protein
MGKSAGGIKINEPAPKTPASIPPSGPQWKITINIQKGTLVMSMFPP